MSYFNITQEAQKRIRVMLLSIILSSRRISFNNPILRELTMMGILGFIKQHAMNEEDYEVVKVIDDILKNKEYQIYEL